MKKKILYEMIKSLEATIRNLESRIRYLEHDCPKKRHKDEVNMYVEPAVPKFIPTGPGSPFHVPKTSKCPRCGINTTSSSNYACSVTDCPLTSTNHSG